MGVIVAVGALVGDCYCRCCYCCCRRRRRRRRRVRSSKLAASNADTIRQHLKAVRIIRLTVGIRILGSDIIMVSPAI